MRFLSDTPPPYDLTYSDVFMVPSMSAVGSRLYVDLATTDRIGTTIPIVVSNMTAVAGRRMAETVSRRGGLVVLPQDIPLDVIEKVVTFVKSRHHVYDTPITLAAINTVGDALGLIHKRAHGAVIVVDDDGRPEGIFTEHDAVGYDRFTQLQNAMSRELAAARGEATPAVSIRDGARAVILADAVLESARGGGIPVRPNLEAIAAVREKGGDPKVEIMIAAAIR